MMSNNATIGFILQAAKNELIQRHLDLNAAEILLETRLNMSRSTLWSSLDSQLSASDLAKFHEDFARYLEGEPVQYILNTAPFYGWDFYVDSRVLIPRPETEELVLLTEQFIHKSNIKKIADICTGSGAIAISLKKLFPDAEVTGTDISTEALDVARQNATSLQADVYFQKMNLVDGLIKRGEKFPIIVANPPYIAANEKAIMSSYVLNHEPEIALFAAHNGLALYEELIKKLPNVVCQKYFIAVEIGYTQGEAVKKLFQKSFPQACVVIHKDINGKNRIISCSNVLI